MISEDATLLGLELNRLFLAIESEANRQRLIDFARSILEIEEEARRSQATSRRPPFSA